MSDKVDLPSSETAPTGEFSTERNCVSAEALLFRHLTCPNKNDRQIMVLPRNVIDPIILPNEKQGDLLSLVECPICMRVPASRINECKNGHHVCSTCRQKLKKCPQCSAPFSTTPHLFAEHLVALLTLKCEHVGCNATFSGDTHRHHVDNCEYRPVPCYAEGLTNKCKGKGTLIDFTDYERHLKSDHLIFGYDEEQPCYVFFQSFAKTDYVYTYTVCYMMYDQKFFLLHVSEYENTIYSWITIVEPGIGHGPNYEASLTYYVKDSHRARSVWQIQIHNFRKERKSVMETGDFVGLQKDVLIPSSLSVKKSSILGKRTSNGFYEWRITVRIRPTKESNPIPGSSANKQITESTESKPETDQLGSNSDGGGSLQDMILQLPKSRNP